MGPKSRGAAPTDADSVVAYVVHSYARNRFLIARERCVALSAANAIAAVARGQGFGPQLGFAEMGFAVVGASLSYLPEERFRKFELQLERAGLIPVAQQIFGMVGQGGRSAAELVALVDGA